MNLRHPSSDRLPYHAPQRRRTDDQRFCRPALFTEYEATIPRQWKNQTAILSRRFGQGITVDLWGPDSDAGGCDGRSDKGGDIWTIEPHRGQNIAHPQGLH